MVCEQIGLALEGRSTLFLLCTCRYSDGSDRYILIDELIGLNGRGLCG